MQIFQNIQNFGHAGCNNLFEQKRERIDCVNPMSVFKTCPILHLNGHSQLCNLSVTEKGQKPFPSTEVLARREGYVGFPLLEQIL